MSATKDDEPVGDVEDTTTDSDGADQTSDATDNVNEGFDWKATIPAVAVLMLLGDAIAGDVGPASDYELGNLEWMHGFISGPVGWVEEIIVGFIYDTFLYPVGSAFWNAGVSTVDAFIVLGFGSDRAIGIAEGSSFGILDIPFVIIAPFVDAMATMTSGAVGIVASFNSGVASAVSGFGIAAPLVVNTMVVGEVVIIAWGTWTLINLIDIPVVRVMGFLSAATAPFRRLLGGFK